MRAHVHILRKVHLTMCTLASIYNGKLDNNFSHESDVTSLQDLTSRPTVQQKKRRIIISVFLQTLQLTALLLKSVHLRLHCYTLIVGLRSAPSEPYFFCHDN